MAKIGTRAFTGEKSGNNFEKSSERMGFLEQELPRGTLRYGTGKSSGSGIFASSSRGNCASSRGEERGKEKGNKKGKGSGGEQRLSEVGVNEEDVKYNISRVDMELQTGTSGESSSQQTTVLNMPGNISDSWNQESSGRSRPPRLRKRKLRGVGRNRESSGAILEYLLEKNAKLGRGTPTPFYPDEKSEDFDTWAELIGEDELEPICNIGMGLLVRSDSGVFYFVLDKVFHELGTKLDEVLEFFDGTKDIKKAKRIDPFHVLEAHEQHKQRVHDFLQQLSKELKESE